MATETIIAVFDTAAHANEVIHELETKGVPSNAIRHYSKEDPAYREETATGERRHRGFWGWLTGENETDRDDDHVLYSRAVESGGTVVTVIANDADASRIVALLEAHSPLDLEEGASQFGIEGPATGVPGAPVTGVAEGYASSTAPRTSGVGIAGGGAIVTGAATAAQGLPSDRVPERDRLRGRGTEEVIPLAEETLEVGKRVVDHGTTRVRRHVVERPVEEVVRLRDEHVSVERRPVAGTAAVAADAFTDKELEFNETSEEAVVAKRARVAEEVVIRKDANERDETVRDTVRHEEIDIDRPTGAAREVRKDSSR